MTSGLSVDYLRDYDAGNQLLFSDNLSDIAYHPEKDYTSLLFQLEGEQSPIEWKFAGNLTSQYQAGQPVNLNLTVIRTGQYGNHDFESIDLFEDSIALEKDNLYPNIEDYQC